jgi:hypothetical protein
MRVSSANLAKILIEFELSQTIGGGGAMAPACPLATALYVLISTKLQETVYTSFAPLEA